MEGHGEGVLHAGLTCCWASRARRGIRSREQEREHAGREQPRAGVDPRASAIAAAAVWTWGAAMRCKASQGTRASHGEGKSEDEGEDSGGVARTQM